MKEKDIVMVKVERTTRDRLKARGRKGETYEKVITKMFAALEGDKDKVEGEDKEA